MPERKYYDEDELNHAYVYTNIDKVKIAEDMAKDYITTNNAIRNDDLYDEINIPQYIKGADMIKHAIVENSVKYSSKLHMTNILKIEYQ